MSDPVRNIFIDNRIEAYSEYLPDDWAVSTFANAKPGSALDYFAVDLMLSWRTTSYTASIPATMIKAIQSSTLAFARWFLVGAPLVMSILVIILAILRVAGVQYVATVLDSTPVGVLFIFIVMMYVAFWLFEYWVNRWIGEELLEVLCD